MTDSSLTYKRDTTLLKRQHRSVISIFNLLPRGTVLDIAAGEGDISNVLISMGFKVTSCDINPTNCRSRGIPAIAVDLNSNNSMPFKDKSFNYIIVTESMQYLENPHLLFREITRLAKPECLLIVTFPNILNIQSRIKFLFNGYPDFFKPSYFIRTSKESFSKIGINPISLVEFKLLVDRFEWKIKTVSASRFKRNILFYLPCAILIYMLSFITTIFKKDNLRSIKRLLNSKELLFGEGLMIVAKKVSY